MNRWRSFLALVGVFVALVVLFVLQGANNISNPANQGNDNTDSVALQNTPVINPLPEGLSPIFEDISENGIQAIRFEDPFNEDAITLRRRTDNNQWQAAEFSLDINQDIAKALAQTIAILPYTVTLPDIAPEDYAQFGLTQDTVLLLVSILMKNGDEHVIAIGILTPDNLSHYVLIDDHPDIYVVPRQPISFLLAYPGELVN